MSPPIRDGSGSSIGSIRLGDGSEISEVRTGAGDVLFSASTIPDSDLYQHYQGSSISATDGDSVSTWSDDSGNGHDLTAGTAPTYRTNVLNGEPAVRFDGVDDILTASISNTQSQPFEIYTVAIFHDVSARHDVHAGAGVGGDAGLLFVGSDGNFNSFAATILTDGAADTNAHLFTQFHNGQSSFIEVDGSRTSGDAGTRGYTDFTVGDRSGEGAKFDGDVLEIAVYSAEKTSAERSDINSYFNNKYGLSI